MQTENQTRKRKRFMLREVRVVHLISYALISPAIVVGIWLHMPEYIIPKVTQPWITIIYIVAVILSYIFTKRFVIGLVLAYKAFAPMDVRESCRFTPTCSTYMIMAINKYGLLIGVIKGIRRIRRCKPPYGGVDYP